MPRAATDCLWGRGEGRAGTVAGVDGAALAAGGAAGLAAACALFAWQKWGGIVGFALGDTDDNLRMAQVRALAERAGLVRPSPISLRPGVRRRQHPLEPDRRPADRRADPARQAVHRRRHAERMAVAVAPLLPLRRAADRHRADRPAAGQPGGVRRGLCRALSSPARPTACSCRPGSTITAGSWRC